jgi:hypothetical protein
MVGQKADLSPDGFGKMRQAADVVKAFDDRLFVQGQLAVLSAQPLMIRMLTSTAQADFSRLDSMRQPCSVKARGRLSIRRRR